MKRADLLPNATSLNKKAPKRSLSFLYSNQRHQFQRGAVALTIGLVLSLFPDVRSGQSEISEDAESARVQIPVSDLQFKYIAKSRQERSAKIYEYAKASNIRSPDFVDLIKEITTELTRRFEKETYTTLEPFTYPKGKDAPELVVINQISNMVSFIENDEKGIIKGVPLTKPKSMSHALWHIHRFLSITDVELYTGDRAKKLNTSQVKLAQGATELLPERLFGWVFFKADPQTFDIEFVNAPVSHVPPAPERGAQVEKLIKKGEIFFNDTPAGYLVGYIVTGPGHTGAKPVMLENLHKKFANGSKPALIRYGGIGLYLGVQNGKLKSGEPQIHFIPDLDDPIPANKDINIGGSVTWSKDPNFTRLKTPDF